MGYRVIDPATVDPAPDRPCTKRAIGDAGGLEHVAFNLYEPAPGEQIPLAYHYHDRQEEAFYVVAGELRVETPGETYAVESGELLVADPESPHRAFAPETATEPTRVLALGAPAADDAHPYEP